MKVRMVTLVVAVLSVLAPAYVALAGPLTSQRSPAGGAAPWSSPATWGGRVPGPADEVTIAKGTTVEVDTEAAEAAYLVVHGTLRFRRDMPTKLTIHNGSIEVFGSLLMGTRNRPIPRPHTATLELVEPEGEMYVGGSIVNPREDHGVWVMANGTFHVNGHPIKNTWSYLRERANAGTSRLVVEDDVTDWQNGDEVVVTVLRRDLGGRFGDPIDFIVRARVASVERTSNKPGSIVALDQPLPHTALADYGYWSAIGNLTRNVKVQGRHANDYRRPHVWWRDDAHGTVTYAEFSKLGPMGDHNYPSGDMFRPVARWAVHYHPDNGWIVGNSVHDIGKMGIVLHHSVGSYVMGNVIAGPIMAGAGIWNEADTDGNRPAREAKIWGNMVAFPHSYRLNPENGQSSTFHRPMYLSIPGDHSVVGNYFMGGYYTAYFPFAEWRRGECFEFQYNVMYSGTVGLLLQNYKPAAGCPEIKGNVSGVHDYAHATYGLEDVTFSDCIASMGVLTNWSLSGRNVTVKNCHVFSTPSPWGDDVQRALGAAWAGAPAFRLDGTDIKIVDSRITGHYDYGVVDKPYCCEELVQARFTNTIFDLDTPYEWWTEKLVAWGPPDQRPHRDSVLEFRNYTGLYRDELGANFDIIPVFRDGAETTPYINGEGYLLRR